eukprot:m.62716 g.62716  ORF g.62716 m.62716 type:complete len:122 (-) comp11529_c0_seq2:77-442(-)
MGRQISFGWEVNGTVAFQKHHPGHGIMIFCILQSLSLTQMELFNTLNTLRIVLSQCNNLLAPWISMCSNRNTQQDNATILSTIFIFTRHKNTKTRLSTCTLFYICSPEKKCDYVDKSIKLE